MDISRLFRNGRHVYFVFLDEKEKSHASSSDEAVVVEEIDFNEIPGPHPRSVAGCRHVWSLSFGHWFH